MIISRIIEEKSQKKATSVRQEYLSVKTSYTTNTQCQSSQHAAALPGARGAPRCLAARRAGSGGRLRGWAAGVVAVLPVATGVVKKMLSLVTVYCSIL